MFTGCYGFGGGNNGNTATGGSSLAYSSSPRTHSPSMSPFVDASWPCSEPNFLSCSVDNAPGDSHFYSSVLSEPEEVSAPGVHERTLSSCAFLNVQHVKSPSEASCSPVSSSTTPDLNWELFCPPTQMRHNDHHHHHHLNHHQELNQLNHHHQALNHQVSHAQHTFNETSQVNCSYSSNYGDADHQENVLNSDHRYMSASQANRVHAFNNAHSSDCPPAMSKWTANNVSATKSQLIKEGLKVSIASRRSATNCTSSNTSTESSEGQSPNLLQYTDEGNTLDSELSQGPSFNHAPFTPGSECGSTPEDDERRRRRRERNKVAATKCRHKKKAHVLKLGVESQVLDIGNAALKQELLELDEERDRLLSLLESHRPFCRHSEQHVQS